MTYILVELFIFVTWLVIFVTRIRKRTVAAAEELAVLLIAAPFAVVMEIRNEYLNAGQGVYYPASLFYFPDFKFPFAIALSSSIYPWLLFVAARYLAARLAKPGSRFLIPIQLGVVLVLLASFVFPEDWGVRLDYWRWHVTPPDIWIIWLAKYIFYFKFTFPPIVLANLLSWRFRRALEATGSSPMPPHAAQS